MVAALLLAVAIAFFFLKKCISVQPDIIAAKDSVQYRWTDDSLRMITFIKQREQDFNKISQMLRDSIKKLQSGKFKNLNTAARIILSGSVRLGDQAEGPDLATNGDVVSPSHEINNTGQIFVRDTVQQDFHNDWYKVKTAINLSDRSKSYTEITTKDSLTYIDEYVKEGGIFNRRTFLQVSISNSNPYNKISGMEVYRKPLPKPKRFGLGPQVGATLSADMKVKPYIGIGGSYNLIRF